MNNLKDFKTFYLDIVLPNLPSFGTSFNENNFDENISELIEVFKSSYYIDPFDISEADEITNKLKNKNEDFVLYSDSKGSGVPNSLLNTHYFNFLKYRDELEFDNLQDLVNKLNQAFGTFTKTFQNERIKLNGNQKIPSNSVIFGNVRDDYWTINKGGERELQYHIFKNENTLGYGLGFNAQKSMNNLSPEEDVSKFVSAFVLNKNTIFNSLRNYKFINHTLEDLINIQEGEFILFGRTFTLKLNENNFMLNQFDFLNIYYDLRYRQFNAYKRIYNAAISNPLPASQLLKQDNMKNLLYYKKQIILQGPPGTGKTREAQLIAQHMLGLSNIEELKDNDQFKLVQFHPSYSYEDFVRGIVAHPTVDGKGVLYTAKDKLLAEFALKAFEDDKNNYVLIIDEINRANLSAVLGELIYALEYRDEEVTSMYSVMKEGEEDSTIVLPSNLYIIGTMNTADRSVGHIDYAIQRRFAFVDVLPQELNNDDTIVFHKELFKKISLLFVENYEEYVSNDKIPLKRAKTLSQEFRVEDVWLGHSYFIQKIIDESTLLPQDFKIRIDYEIKPILLQYEKDGILIGEYEGKSVKDYIKSL